MKILTIQLATRGKHSPIRERGVPMLPSPQTSLICEAKSALSFRNQPLHTGEYWQCRNLAEARDQTEEILHEQPRWRNVIQKNTFKKMVRPNSSSNLTSFGSTMHGVCKVRPLEHAVFTETNEKRRGHQSKNFIITTFRRHLQRWNITRLENLKGRRPG